MRRLTATMHCDLRLQWRNGFYAAMAVVLLFWAALLSQIPQLDLTWLLPPLVVGNLLITTFYFVGGMVLLEKGEGTLESQVVSPLRNHEYLAAKTATLTLLALLENIAVVVLFHGVWFNWALLVVGLMLASAIFVLAGFVAVVRYNAINAYLLPSVVYATLLVLPLFAYLGRWWHPLLLLHPLQAPLVLIQAAFGPVAAWQLLYGVFYSAMWVAVFAWFSRRAFHRFVVEQ